MEELIEDRPVQQRADVPLDNRIIGQVEAEAEAIERFNSSDSDQAHVRPSLLQGRNRLRPAPALGHLPAAPKLIAMERGPFKHECQGPTWELATVDFQRFDENQRLRARVLGMKVRRLMIIIEHLDHDAKKPADLRHTTPTGFRDSCGIAG